MPLDGSPFVLLLLLQQGETGTAGTNHTLLHRTKALSHSLEESLEALRMGTACGPLVILPGRHPGAAAQGTV